MRSGSLKLVLLLVLQLGLDPLLEVVIVVRIMVLQGSLYHR